MHEVLVNRLGGLSLPRKSVVRLTDRPDMTLDVYRGRKTTIQSINRGFPKALFIDLLTVLVLVLHMVREIWWETDRIKAGKNFKETEPKFSNVTALNGLAKFYCIIVSADRTLQIYATICIFQIRNLSYTDVTHITHVTFVRNTKSLEIGNMPMKSSELRQAS